MAVTVGLNTAEKVISNSSTTSDEPKQKGWISPSIPVIGNGALITITGIMLVAAVVAAVLVFGGFLSPFALGIVAMSLWSILTGSVVAVAAATPIVLIKTPIDDYETKNGLMGRIRFTLGFSMGLAAATLLGFGVIATGITLSAMGIVAAPVTVAAAPVVLVIGLCIGAGAGLGMLLIMVTTSFLLIVDTLRSFAELNARTKQQTAAPGKTVELEKSIVVAPQNIVEPFIGSYSNPLKNSQNFDDVKVKLVEDTQFTVAM